MIVHAPQNFDEKPQGIFSVFLSGSIEKDKKIDWQMQIEQVFGAREDIRLFNPRRPDWDNSWRQEASDPQFNEQVSWELRAMEAADFIVVYFAAESQSPITLLEFGLFARSGKLIVYCPDGFWRKGNVDMVCQKYAVKQVQSLAEIIEIIDEKSNR